MLDVQALVKCDNANDFSLALFAVMLLGTTDLKLSGGVKVIVVFHNEVCSLCMAINRMCTYNQNILGPYTHISGLSRQRPGAAAAAGLAFKKSLCPGILLVSCKFANQFYTALLSSFCTRI